MFKKISIVWLLSLLILFQNCTPHLLPPANAELVTDLNTIQDNIQSLYDSPDPNFSQAAHDRVDAQIAAIVSTESARPHAAGLMASAKRIQDMFSKFEAEWKSKGTLTAFVRAAHKEDMFGIIKPLVISEMTIK